MKSPNFKTTRVVLAATAVSIAAISCVTMERVMVAPPMIPGAKYVGMDTCAVCHEKQARDFKLTSHARIHIPNEKVQGQGCESCHGPGSLHAESEGKKPGLIMNPGKSPGACFQCHLDKNAQFSLPSHHPVKEGRMSCSDCHDSHGEDIHKSKGTLVARVNDRCAQCHREQTRPHVHEHEALREGCTTCHEVHGSFNNKMLVQRDNNLCLKCHAQVSAAPGAGVLMGTVPHTGRLSQGTCFSAGCHTAVHGSDLYRNLQF